MDSTDAPEDGVDDHRDDVDGVDIDGIDGVFAADGVSVNPVLFGDGEVYDGAYDDAEEPAGVYAEVDDAEAEGTDVDGAYADVLVVAGVVAPYDEYEGAP